MIQLEHLTKQYGRDVVVSDLTLTVKTGELLVAPAEFMLVVSYNPGYQNLFKNLKPSTRQRFVALSFDFPAPDLEARIVEAESGLDAERTRRLVGLGRALRELGPRFPPTGRARRTSWSGHGMHPTSSCPR